MIVTSFRTRAAISAAGAAVVAALTLVAAPTTHAQDLWGGIGTSPGGGWQILYDKPTNVEAAYFGIYKCGPGCAKRLLFNDCAALAYDGTNFSPAAAATESDAQSAALAALPGGQIVVSGCNGQGNATVIGQGFGRG